MIVVYMPVAEPYKPAGFVQETTHSGDFERMKEVYTRHGLGVTQCKDTLPIGEIYVDVATEVVKMRPQIKVVASKSEIVADGVDEVVLTLDPPRLQAIVKFNDIMVFQGQITDGKIEVSAEHPGEYVINLIPEFPHQPNIVTIKAI